MTDTESSRPVVVGVDGSDYALHALDWAADEAARRGWPLRIVNAYQSYSAAIRGLAEPLPAASEESRKILIEARDRAARSHPYLEVSTGQSEGPTPRFLLKEGSRGRMLVLGREGIGRFAELAMGSVSLAVATRATVPVVVIPRAWEPPAEPYGRIVLGIDGSENCDAAAGFAFQTAAERDAELVVLHAWHQPTRWSERWPLGPEDPRFKVEYERILAAATDRWVAEYPQVKMTDVSAIDHPAAALARRSADADLVVIGGRGHGTVTGMLLGSVARAILRHVDRPIAVVHQPRKS